MTAPTPATDRTLQRVVVEMASGVQTSIDPDTTVVGPDGPLLPEEVPNALSDPDGWIEYASSVRWEDEDAPPLEAWQAGACRVRLWDGRAERVEDGDRVLVFRRGLPSVAIVGVERG